MYRARERIVCLKSDRIAGSRARHGIWMTAQKPSLLQTNLHAFFMNLSPVGEVLFNSIDRSLFSARRQSIVAMKRATGTALTGRAVSNAIYAFWVQDPTGISMQDVPFVAGS